MTHFTDKAMELAMAAANAKLDLDISGDIHLPGRDGPLWSKFTDASEALRRHLEQGQGYADLEAALQARVALAAENERLRGEILRLIAAAPDLLAALESAKWMLERDYIDDQKMAVIEKCDAAIAKATGVTA